MKSAKSNMNMWGIDDPRWEKTYWKSFDAYHNSQERFFAEFVQINVRSWAEKMGYTEAQMGAAMYLAWRLSPFRFGVHGVPLFLGEQKAFCKMRDEALKPMVRFSDKMLKVYRRK